MFLIPVLWPVTLVLIVEPLKLIYNPGLVLKIEYATLNCIWTTGTYMNLKSCFSCHCYHSLSLLLSLLIYDFQYES